MTDDKLEPATAEDVKALLDDVERLHKVMLSDTSHRKIAFSGPRRELIIEALEFYALALQATLDGFDEHD